MTIAMQNRDDDIFEWLSTWKWDKVRYREMKLNELIDDWYITREEILLLRWLTFTDTDIIDNHLDIRFLLKLTNDNIIGYKKLRYIVEKEKQEIQIIKDKLSWMIAVDSLTAEQQVLVMNVLDIW